MVALKAMHHVLKEKMAFTKFEGLMGLLQEFKVVSCVENRPQNAKLTSERLKADIIGALGTNYSQ